MISREEKKNRFFFPSLKAGILIAFPFYVRTWLPMLVLHSFGAKSLCNPFTHLSSLWCNSCVSCFFLKIQNVPSDKHIHLLFIYYYCTCQKMMVSFIYGLELLSNTIVCIYPTPLSGTECDTRSISKQSKEGLNWVFFLIDWLPKEPSLPYYLPIAEGRKRWVKRTLLGFELQFSNSISYKDSYAKHPQDQCICALHRGSNYLLSFA